MLGRDLQSASSKVSRDTLKRQVSVEVKEQKGHFTSWNDSWAPTCEISWVTRIRRFSLREDWALWRMVELKFLHISPTEPLASVIMKTLGAPQSRKSQLDEEMLKGKRAAAPGSAGYDMWQWPEVEGLGLQGQAEFWRNVFPILPCSLLGQIPPSQSSLISFLLPSTTYMFLCETPTPGLSYPPSSCLWRSKQKKSQCVMLTVMQWDEHSHTLLKANIYQELNKYILK